MAYADSALDYKYEIEELRVADQYMRVKYYTTDSADGRPDLFRNFEVLSHQMDSVSIHNMIQADAVGIVTIWDKYLEASAIDSSSLSHLVGVEHSDRYKVRYEEQPEGFVNYNWRKFKQVAYDSEGPDDITRKFNFVEMDSDEKAVVLASARSASKALRLGLLSTGYLSSVETTLGYDSGSGATNEKIQWEYQDDYSLFDSAMDRVQSTLSLNDSDFVSWLVDNAQFTPFREIVEY